MDEQGQPPADLQSLFASLCESLGDVSRSLEDTTLEYLRKGMTFAVLDADAAELRLHLEVAEAARRTPSTGASSRGPEWVRFAPAQLDQHALDRAEAWFLSAWRAAGQDR
jgi:hypothetical protein